MGMKNTQDQLGSAAPAEAATPDQDTPGHRHTATHRIHPSPRIPINHRVSYI